MTKIVKRSKWLHVRLTVLEFNLVQELIKNLNVTRSELVRMLILAELKKEGKNV